MIEVPSANTGGIEPSVYGSGVIIDEEGYILTNNHIVNSKTLNIKVTTNENIILDSKVVWEEPSLDLTILKVSSKNLKEIKINKTGAYYIGDPILVVGSPYGPDFYNTVTAGIISSIQRELEFNGVKMKDLLQIDAPINTGNSGGALVNKNGELIGIVAMQKSDSEGIGFCIRIDYIDEIIKKLKKYNEFIPPKLNLKLNDEYKLNNKNLKLENGLTIEEVLQDNYNKNNELDNGDIILKINNEKINSITDLKNELYKYEAKDKIKLTIKKKNGVLKDIYRLLS